MELARRLRDISKEDAIKSYEELKEIACKKTTSFARAGIKALDYFFSNAFIVVGCFMQKEQRGGSCACKGLPKH